VFYFWCPSAIYLPAREPSALVTVPSTVKKLSSYDPICRLLGRFRDIHSWFLRPRIGSSCQEGFGIRQANRNRVDITQLEMGFATRPEAHPTLLVDLGGGFPTGSTRSLTDCLEPFPKVSSQDTRPILSHSSYHRFPEVAKVSLYPIQPMKHRCGEPNNSRGKPECSIHQGSFCPQYWNANLKRTAHPSPLSAGCFSAVNSVSDTPSLRAGKTNPSNVE